MSGQGIPAPASLPVPPPLASMPMVDVKTGCWTQSGLQLIQRMWAAIFGSAGIVDLESYLIAQAQTPALTYSDSTLVEAVLRAAAQGIPADPPTFPYTPNIPQDPCCPTGYIPFLPSDPQTAGGGGSGDVVGPGSATGNDFAQFDGGTGKLIKDGGLSLDTDGTLASNSDSKIPSQKAVKTYVDAVAQGLSIRDSCLLATAAALPTNTYLAGVITITATGTLTVDGVVTALNDRILVKNEVAGAHNGIYTVTTAGAVGVAAVLTRATDFNSSANIQQGDFTFIESGTANVATGWVLTTSPPITVGTTALTFTQFSAAGGSATPANPTATASDVAVNGVASTYMRSDAAPAVQKGSSSAFGLVKTDDVTIKAASGIITASPRLYSAFASVGNGADTTEDVLQTFTLPSGLLATNGQAIRLRARCANTATSATKTLRMYFGATVVANIANTGTIVGQIQLEALIIRVGASSQISDGSAITAINSTTAGAKFVEPTSPAETLSGGIVVKVTGQSSVGTANITTCDMFLVEFLP